MKYKTYIIVSRIFPNINGAKVPLVGQIAINNKLLAYIIYKYLRRFSYKYDFNTIAVMLMKRINNKYEIIRR